MSSVTVSVALRLRTVTPGTVTTQSKTLALSLDDTSSRSRLETLAEGRLMPFFRH
jgi:hypothetical protein